MPTKLLVATLLFALFHPLAVAQDRAPVTVRVGVVSVEDYNKEHELWTRTLSQLAESSSHRLQFDLALGTYGDLLHWVEQGFVDVAVLTPGIYAEARNRDGFGGRFSDYRYVATISTHSATSPWATQDRRQAGFHFTYHSVAVVSADSPIKTAGDLQREAGRGRLRYVFVHPLSMSGRLAPEYVLRQLGTEPQPRHIEFSYSHSRSLELLTDADSTFKVAFVWDDTVFPTGLKQDRLRRIRIPELDQVELPHDLVLVRKSFAQADHVAQLFLNHQGEALRFSLIDQAETAYGELADWSRFVRPPRAMDDELRRVSVQGIGQLLLHSVRSLQVEPRLAVVLSGGGAKCSYQAGALQALEEHLAELREEQPSLDIDLVVGTSGGAINAIPVALGVSSTTAGANDFREVWKGLDQRRIITPSPVVRANLGVWFAVLQIAAVTSLIARGVATPRRRATMFAASVFAIGLVEIVIGYVAAPPWRLLGMNHVVHHIWLWSSLGIRWSAWCLLTTGLTIALTRRSRWTEAIFQLPIRPTFLVFTVLLTTLPFVQCITMLFFEKTLSRGHGVERALATHFPRLIDKHLARANAQPLALEESKNSAQRLRQVSHAILERELLQRDLVITGNCLAQSSGQLPSDLYFYATARPDSPSPPFGRRGVRLARHPSILLDVVMGSSAIFPLFPSRRISDVPSPNETIELIDGGFAHNSPIEAAVLWGATHVIVIEATPHRRGLRRNLVENTSAAFVHLHKQTQLVDLRSKGTVDVFTLTPEPPHMCVLDFADNLIEASMERGYRDVRGLEGSGSSRRFRKELGSPVFSRVSARHPP